MDRMSPLDAAFLQLEDAQPGTSLAISSIAVFEGPAPSLEELTVALGSRLPLVPRYRQKVRQVPLDLGAPVWVDDPDFDITFHVRRTALPRPGGDRELAALMGRVMSQRLDRNRPLWEYWMVEGLEGDRWAMISKVHHCLVDGVSGTDLYRVLLDTSPEPAPPPPDVWRPEPEPSTLTLAALAARDLGRLPWDTGRAVLGVLRDPAALGRTARTAVRGAAALSAGLLPAPASSLVGPLSAHRRFAFARTSVADISTVRHALGGTFNDVVMAAITSGFRSLLRERGEQPTAHVVRTMVPVNLRAPGEESIRDNRVAMLLAELPVHVADPVERLAAVRAHLAELKAEHEADAGAVILRIAGHEPYPVIAPGMRLTWHLPQRNIITVTTNVPGPQQRIYGLGRPVVEIIPYVPIASRVRIGVSIFSYDGKVTFGVTGDYDAAADVWTLARGIEGGMGQLIAVARGPARSAARERVLSSATAAQTSAVPAHGG